MTILEHLKSIVAKEVDKEYAEWEEAFFILILKAPNAQREFLKKIPEFRKLVIIAEFYLKYGKIPDKEFEQELDEFLSKEKSKE